MNEKVFCIAPFVNFSTTTAGHPRLCCQAETWEDIDISNLSVDQVWQHDKYTEARNKFTQGVWPVECNVCKNNENNNIDSRRQFENNRWKHLNWEEKIANPTIHCYDLRMGNQCNLKCVMCNPNNSNQWLAEKSIHKHLQTQEVVSGHKWAIDGTILDNIMQNLNNVELLYFAGGEPLLIKKHAEMINKCIELNIAQRIELVYDTNGTYITSEWIAKWQMFKSVQLNISIDGGKAVNEYVRFPVDHDVVLNSLKLLKDSGLRVYLQSAIGAHNIFDIQSIIDYKQEFNCHGINISIVHWPEFMTIDNLSDSAKIRCKRLLSDCGISRILQMVNNLKLNNKQPTELRQFFSKLDQSRNLDHTKIFIWIYE